MVGGARPQPGETRTNSSRARLGLAVVGRCDGRRRPPTLTWCRHLPISLGNRLGPPQTHQFHTARSTVGYRWAVCSPLRGAAPRASSCRCRSGVLRRFAWFSFPLRAYGLLQPARPTILVSGASPFLFLDQNLVTGYFTRPRFRRGVSHASARAPRVQGSIGAPALAYSGPLSV